MKTPIIGVTCDPRSELKSPRRCRHRLAVGPEVIAGSTRLKAGTATKVVLNMLTTAAMVRAGKTYGNLMVDVKSNSDKLRDRARRIIGTVTGLDYEAADDLLQRARWNVRRPFSCSRPASRALRRSHGFASNPDCGSFSAAGKSRITSTFGCS